MSRLAALKDKVVAQLAVGLPISLCTLGRLTHAPEWQVEYALESLRGEGRVERSGTRKEIWKLRERKPVRMCKL